VQDTNKCWLKNAGKFQRELLDKIRSKSDPVQLVEMIYKVIGNLQTRQLKCYRRWLLNSAIWNNHTELITYLLRDKRNRIQNRRTNCFIILNGSVCCRTLMPLFVAMEKGDLHLVRRILRAGSAVTLEIGRHTHVIGTWSASISAIEYALVLDRPEMLPLLVDHYYNHRRRRFDKI